MPEIIGLCGTPLLLGDYASLSARWIDRQTADTALLRRVDCQTGSTILGRNSYGHWEGIAIPYVMPGESRVRDFRIRRDHPEIENGKPRQKYVAPPGRGNMLYFLPGTDLALLADATLPVVITEGEFKVLALARAAALSPDNAGHRPPFLPVGVSGVWNWRGTIGKKTDGTGTRVDEKGPIPDLNRIVWKGRQVVIAFDADAVENSKVRAALSQLTCELVNCGALVGHLEWPLEEGKGIDDRLAAVGSERVLADLANVQFGDWHTQLLRSDRGKLLTCYENAALFLEKSPEWSGVLGYNEFTAGYVLLEQPPFPIAPKIGSEIEDPFDTEVVRWLERHGLMVKPDMVRRLLDGLARRQSFHPILNYLESLPPWDGIRRIGTWRIDYCGVGSSDQNPNRFAEAVGEKFLISTVARVKRPGCKVDHVLILEGPQGIGKSTVPRILAGEDYFTDQLADMGSKDSSMQLRGAWLIELSELDALNRSEMARAKAFITQQTERFRLPYGRRIVDVPRQCVFVGTTNADTWLKDETGGRRFWPVRCGAIDLNALRRDRDQLWAEALHAFHSGASWWLDDPDLVQEGIEEQHGRYLEDVWQEKVLDYADSESESLTSGSKRGTVSIFEILQRFGIEPAKQSQSDANRVARCLRVGGWERSRVGPRSAREWRYRKGVSQ